MVEYKMGVDKNGNKVVKVTGTNFQGFSIQTNDNLPLTHRTNIPHPSEIVGWIMVYGTLRQKSLFS